MQEKSLSSVKATTATKRFLRYHPQKIQRLEDKIDEAEKVSLWEYLDYPKLYDERLSSGLNLENFKKVTRLLKHHKIKIRCNIEFRDICFFQLLCECIKQIPVHKIKNNYFLQEIDFEKYINNNLNELFNQSKHFSQLLFTTPWRQLYPFISERLKINGITNSYAFWDFLESDFKIRLGSTQIKRLDLCLQHFDGEMAILYLNYHLKVHSKAAAQPAQLKILARRHINFWQFCELQSDELFETRNYITMIKT